MTRFKKQTIIQFLFLFVYQGNCDTISKNATSIPPIFPKETIILMAPSHHPIMVFPVTGNQKQSMPKLSDPKLSSPKLSGQMLMRQDDDFDDHEEITEFSEIPNGYKSTKKNQKKKSFHQHQSSESEEDYSTSTVSVNGQPPRSYTRFTYRNDHSSGPPPAPYYDPPYYSNHDGRYSNTRQRPPTNHYNNYLSNDRQLRFRDDQGQDNGQFGHDYLKGVFKGYEMAKEIEASGRSMPKSSDVNLPRASRRSHHYRPLKEIAHDIRSSRKSARRKLQF